VNTEPNVFIANAFIITTTGVTICFAIAFSVRVDIDFFVIYGEMRPSTFENNEINLFMLEDSEHAFFCENCII